MKYFYTNNGRNNLYEGKNFDKIINDPDKAIIIKNDDNDYKVLETDRGTYKDDMVSYCFYDLSRSLRRKQKNMYFLNGSKDDAALLLDMSLVDQPYRYINIPEEEKSIYTVSDGKLIKVKAFVQSSDLAKAINDCYTAELLDDPSKFTRVSLEELVSNKELLSVYHFPIKIVSDKFVIPKPDFSSPNLFYTLSSMYDYKHTFIPLSEEDVRNLYMFSYSKHSDIVASVIDSVTVDKVEEYSLSRLEDSVKQLEEFKEHEKDHNLQLDNANKIIKKAKQNEPVFANLHLLETIEERKARQLQIENPN